MDRPAFELEQSMKSFLLLASGITGYVCLGLFAAQAEVMPLARPEPLQYSRPIGDTRLAQVNSACTGACQQTLESCMEPSTTKLPPPPLICKSNYDACVGRCGGK
jgi:hypothetical protein